MPRLRMRLSIHYSRCYSCDISLARIDEIGGAPIFPCYDSLFFSPKNEQFYIILRMLQPKQFAFAGIVLESLKG